MQSKLHIIDSDSGSTERAVSRKEKFCLMINLTESMLASAKKGEWEKLIAYEAERKVHLDQFFAASVSPDEVEWIKPGIEYIMGVDKQLVIISEAAKKVMVESRNGMAKGQHAAKAYSGM